MASDSLCDCPTTEAKKRLTALDSFDTLFVSSYKKLDAAFGMARLRRPKNQRYQPSSKKKKTSGGIMTLPFSSAKMAPFG